MYCFVLDYCSGKVFKLFIEAEAGKSFETIEKRLKSEGFKLDEIEYLTTEIDEIEYL